MGTSESKPTECIESQILKRDSALLLDSRFFELRRDITPAIIKAVIDYFAGHSQSELTLNQQIFYEFVSNLSLEEDSTTTWNGVEIISNDNIDRLLNNEIFKRIWVCTFQHEIHSVEYCKINLNGVDTLLSRETALMLNLQFLNQKQWTQVFNSSQGKSYTLLLQSLEQCAESLFLIRDMDGHIFGFYTYDPWIPSPKFYGKFDNFLYSSFPRLRIYHTTGINSNYVYFNHGQQSLINGIGLGGQLDYFGVYINEEFQGHSRAEPKSTTYGNYQLSKQQNFEIDRLEVFMMEKREVIKKEKTGALNDQVASALLEMSGKKLYSKDLQEPEKK